MSTYNESWMLRRENAVFSSTLLVAALLMVSILFVLRKKKDVSCIYPPYAPFGSIDTMKMLSRGESVSYAVQAAKQVGPVFRCRLPFPGPMVVVLAELNAVRAVLNDKRSIKSKNIIMLFPSVQ